MKTGPMCLPTALQFYMANAQKYPGLQWLVDVEAGEESLLT